MFSWLQTPRKDYGGIESGRRIAIGRRKRMLLVAMLMMIMVLQTTWLLCGSRAESEESRTKHLRIIWIAGRSRQTDQSFPRWDHAHEKWNWSDSDFNINDGAYKRDNPHTKAISCPKLFKGDPAEVERAKIYMSKNPKKMLSSMDYVSMASNCEEFRNHRGYFMKPLSKEEHDFPLAFTLLGYKDVEQIERLLRAIYMPQNYYCIHLDANADEAVFLAMAAISRCFPNVFIASKLERVYWGHISIIRAELNCITDLLHYKWKYYINLSAQMFPLHSNRELVKTLTLYGGANDIEGTYQRSRIFWMAVRQTFSWTLWESLNTMMMTILPKSSPPHNITIYKGSNNVAISRAFAIFLIKSQVAHDLMDWFEDTLAPDEYVWPTLNHNPHLHAPGGYLGDPEKKTFTARASMWLPLANQVNWSWKDWECQGKWVREICIFGIGDLPWLAKRPELFANKFFYDQDYLAYDCMEEYIFNKTMVGDSLKFDPSYYKKLPFVRNTSLVIRPDNELDIQR